MYCNVFGTDYCEEFPDNIKELLKFFKGEKVVIVLKSGRKRTVIIDAVVGDLLIISLNKCVVEFIDINCICGVLAERKNISGNVYKQSRVNMLKNDTELKEKGKPVQLYGWQKYQNNQKL